MPRVAIERLRGRAEKRLCGAGVSPQQAAVLVDHMLTADLWGRGSHGLSIRFEPTLRHATEGPGEQPCEVVQDGGHHVVLDANNGFGYVAGRRSADMLVERAHQHGVASVVVRNSIHTGMMGYYADRLAREDVVSMVTADCLPLMAPHGGTQRLLGTNPLCFGFPADDHPILIDMATSAVSYGEVTEKDRAGEELPEGVALDENGHPTLDPSEARDGALLPFDGHRGGALAIAVQLLSGALTGADPIPEDGTGYGLFMIGLQKGVFAGEAGYEGAVREFVGRYNAVPARSGEEVRLPGTKRYRIQRENLEDGTVSISDDLAETLGL